MLLEPVVENDVANDDGNSVRDFYKTDGNVVAEAILRMRTREQTFVAQHDRQRRLLAQELDGRRPVLARSFGQLDTASNTADGNRESAVEGETMQAEQQEEVPGEARQDSSAAVTLPSEMTELDLDILKPDPPRRRSPALRSTDLVYLKACELYDVVPAQSFLSQTVKAAVSLSCQMLKAQEVKPIAVALVNDHVISTLDLSSNHLGPVGVLYLAEMLQTNTTILDLNLSRTFPGRDGLRALTDTLKHNSGLRILHLSGNKIEHTEASLVADLIQTMPKLRELYVGHNNLGYTGGKSIAAALTRNSNLMTLDLQWNHLRRESACHLARALATNSGLRTLNLAWNGFAKEGCLALAQSLPSNTTLQDLDLTCNRIDLKSLGFLLRGLVKNSGLRTLKIGCNPLTTDGAKTLLRSLVASNVTEMTEVDLRDITVDTVFTDLVDDALLKKGIRVTHEAARVLGTMDQTREHDPTNVDRYEPLTVLFEYMRMDNFRLIDMFKSFDSKKRDKLSKEDFREGLKTLKIPLTEHNLEELVNKMDTNKDGFVDLEEMIRAHRDTSRQINLRLLRAKASHRADQGIAGLRDVLRQIIQKRQAEQDSLREARGLAAEVRRQSEYAGLASRNSGPLVKENKRKPQRRKSKAAKKTTAKVSVPVAIASATSLPVTDDETRDTVAELRGDTVGVLPSVTASGHRKNLERSSGETTPVDARSVPDNSNSSQNAQPAEFKESSAAGEKVSRNSLQALLPGPPTPVPTFGLKKSAQRKKKASISQRRY